MRRIYAALGSKGLNCILAMYYVLLPHTTRCLLCTKLFSGDTDSTVFN